MKILYQVYARIITTKKGERFHHDVINNDYQPIKIQTDHYIEQLKHFHAEEFEKRGKKKGLVTIITITTKEQK